MCVRFIPTIAKEYLKVDLINLKHKIRIHNVFNNNNKTFKIKVETKFFFNSKFYRTVPSRHEVSSKDFQPKILMTSPPIRVYT